MKFAKPVSPEQIEKLTGGVYKGPRSLHATGLNEIHKVEKGDITFTDVPRYFNKALQSDASIVLINQDAEVPGGKGIVICDDPFSAFNRLIIEYHRKSNPTKGSYQSGKHVSIGEGTKIGAGVIIGDNVHIGKSCRIFPNTVLYDDTVISDNVIIHANCTIGADAFYYKRRSEHYDKLLSCGRVIIEADVEIGSGTTVDKGVSGDTLIGKGTKIDSQVHIGHGVVIGNRCLIAAQCGIGGKTLLEDDVTLWGQVGINKDVRVGKGAVLLAQTGVAKSVPGGKTYFGSPAGEAREKMKEISALKFLPGWMKQFR